jgi:uncharacterized RDD family membrane protein YckC
MTDHPPYLPPQPGPPYQHPQYPQSSAEHQLRQPAYPVPAAPDGRPLADPGRRLVARLIDSLVYLVATAVPAGLAVAGLVALLEPVPEDSPLIPATVISTILLLVVGIHYLYEVEVPLRWHGQTPGKRVMKIAIIALEPNVPLSRGRLAYRFVVMFGFNLLSNCYVGLLDPLWCLWDKPYKQCLHDKPAKTVVIRLAPAVPPAGF